MDYEFYDVKKKAKVKAQITAKASYGSANRTRYAFKGQTKDGRSLTVFVGKDAWDKCKAPIAK